MTIIEQIKAVQKALGLEPDGKAGPKTWQALTDKLAKIGDLTAAAQKATIFLPETQWDIRTERLLGTLTAETARYARHLLAAAEERGIECRILSGTRTYAEQDALYAQGRTKRGKRVTNARGGYSNHNFGIAFDVGIFQRNLYLEESPLYKVVGSLGVDLGLDWGGDWKTLVDEPHFQLRPAWARGLSEHIMLAEFRRLVDSGEWRVTGGGK